MLYLRLTLVFLLLLCSEATLLFSQVNNIFYKEEQPRDDKQSVMFYPNPVDGDTFTIKANQNITEIEIMNVIGQIIHRQKNKIPGTEMQVDMSSGQRGLYTIKIVFEDKTSVIKKFMVE